jgi:glutamyl-tRNA reductase
MSTMVIGINHRSGSVDLLERVTLNADALPKAVTSLVLRSNIREAVVLSTCNRTEVYALAERFHGAFDDIRDFFCELSGLHDAEITPHLYSHHDDVAVRHLFAVAAGLDSAVIGESEILGQVRGAWDVARAEGGARAGLNLLFRHALETGKRARTETAISRGTASVSHAAVEMAAQHVGDLAGRCAVVVGAGDMGEGITVALAGAGASKIQVLNRTVSRGQQLADRVGGEVLPLSELPAAIANADVLLTCTGSGEAAIDRDLVAAARDGRSEPLLIVDVAVPRDVRAEVGELSGVTLLNLDDLRDWAASGLRHRAAEADHVRRIVTEEVERFVVESTARQAAPLVAQLHDMAEQLRLAEMQRHERRLGTLDENQQAAVDAATRGVVNKLLHQLSVRLKTDAGTPQGERNAAAVRDLFGLE